MAERDDNQEHEFNGGANGRDTGPENGSAPPPPQHDPSDHERVASTSELSAIQADDALLDALGGSDPRVADELGDQELNALLLSWRRDIDSEPIPELVDVPAATTTVRTASFARRKGARVRRRMLVPVAAAAAVLAIGFTGTALAARDAQPGDTLWGLSKVLYADHARSVEAAASVRTDLQKAYLAIAQERYDDARRALWQAERTLQQVTAEEELVQLKARHTELMAQLEEPQEDRNTSTSPTTTSDSTSSSTDSSTTTPTSPQVEPLPAEPDSTSTSSTTAPPSSTTPTSPSSSTDDSTGSESGRSPGYGASVEFADPTS